MKILIIEDESRVASFIKEGLEEKSYKTVVAYDGITGEEAAMKDDISLVILDLIIPGKSGIDVCRSIKAVRPDLPILMLTALSTTSTRSGALRQGQMITWLSLLTSRSSLHGSNHCSREAGIQRTRRNRSGWLTWSLTL